MEVVIALMTMVKGDVIVVVKSEGAVGIKVSRMMKAGGGGGGSDYAGDGGNDRCVSGAMVVPRSYPCEVT